MNLLLLHPSDYLDSKRVSIRGRRLLHAQKVLRVEKGQKLKVGLLNDKMGSAEILSLSSEEMILKTHLTEMPPQPLPLQLYIALPRPKMLSKVLQTATTLGIKHIHLINAYRVEKSFWHCEQLKSQRVQGSLYLGLEQARDTILPQVHLHRRLKPFAEDELPGRLNGGLAYLAHPNAQQSCPRGHTSSPKALAIGPEGGFIPYEVEMLVQSGFTSVNLGARILKVETALTALVTRLAPPVFNESE